MSITQSVPTATVDNAIATIRNYNHDGGNLSAVVSSISWLHDLIAIKSPEISKADRERFHKAVREMGPVYVEGPAEAKDRTTKQRAASQLLDALSERNLMIQSINLRNSDNALRSLGSFINYDDLGSRTTWRNRLGEEIEPSEDSIKNARKQQGKEQPFFLEVTVPVLRWVYSQDKLPGGAIVNREYIQVADGGFSIVLNENSKVQVDEKRGTILLKRAKLSLILPVPSPELIVMTGMNAIFASRMERVNAKSTTADILIEQFTGLITYVRPR